MSIKDRDYAAIIAKACDKQLNAKEIGRDLWYSLYRDKKLGQVEQIFELAREVIDRQNHQIRAEVYSANPLSNAEKARVVEKFSRLYTESIIIENIIDESLGAGIEVKIAQKTFDFSLKGKIQQLSKKLKEKYEV